jgi:hypothetical protein
MLLDLNALLMRTGAAANPQEIVEHVDTGCGDIRWSMKKGGIAACMVRTGAEIRAH